MIITAIVEMSKGSKYKYEYNKAVNQLVLDRPINQEIPHNYGYIDNTLAPDGDPLDIFIITDAPIPPLTRVFVKVIGAYLCKDGGVSDDKIIGVILDDPSVATKSFVKDYGTGLYFSLEDVLTYLKTYKKGFEVSTLASKEVAELIVEKYKC